MKYRCYTVRIVFRIFDITWLNNISYFFLNYFAGCDFWMSVLP